SSPGARHFARAEACPHLQAGTLYRRLIGVVDERLPALAFTAGVLHGPAMTSDLSRTIDDAWERRDSLGPETKDAVRDAVETALAELDAGRLRVAEKFRGEWHIHQWLKKAVLLSFRLNGMKPIEGGPGGAAWWDKVDSKFAGWSDEEFR